MLIGFRAARGVTYHASSGASTSRNVPSPSRIREIGEAVRRIRTLQWRELTEFGPLYGPETVGVSVRAVNLLTDCQCPVDTGSTGRVGTGRVPGGDVRRIEPLERGCP